jgi:hypothetical protein
MIARSLQPLQPLRRQALMVVDDFQAHPNEKATHGGQVADTAMRSGQLHPEDVWKVQYDFQAPPLPAPTDPEFAPNLQRHLIAKYINHTEVIADALAMVAYSDDSPVKVINVSSGIQKSHLAYALMLAAGADPTRRSPPSEFRDALCHTLQLPLNARHADVRQGIVDLVHHTLENSPEVHAARCRHEQVSADLEKAGVLYCNSAGNEGERAKADWDTGLQIPDDFYQNNISNGHNLSVGATETERGWFSNTIRPAEYTSPISGAEISADGQVWNESEVGPAVLSGTSFASPKVAGFATRLALGGMPMGAILDALFQTATPTPKDSHSLGAGIVDFKRCARAVCYAGYRQPNDPVKT